MSDLHIRGVVPAELRVVPATWSNWPLAVRMVTAQTFRAYSPDVQDAAVAITLVEQPGQIPVNNCCGLMPWDRKPLWGWSLLRRTAMPCGYTLLREGQTGLQGVFFAFPSVIDSLHVLMAYVKLRRILTGEVYAKRWVGTGDRWKRAGASFDRALHRVRCTYS